MNVYSILLVFSESWVNNLLIMKRHPRKNESITNRYVILISTRLFLELFIWMHVYHTISPALQLRSPLYQTNDPLFNEETCFQDFIVILKLSLQNNYKILKRCFFSITYMIYTLQISNQTRIPDNGLGAVDYSTNIWTLLYNCLTEFMIISFNSMLYLRYILCIQLTSV